MDYDELEMKNLIEEIRKHVKKSVKKERYEHSVRTAEFSSRMGRIYQVDGAILREFRTIFAKT